MACKCCKQSSGELMSCSYCSDSLVCNTVKVTIPAFSASLCAAAACNTWAGDYTLTSTPPVGTECGRWVVTVGGANNCYVGDVFSSVDEAFGVTSLLIWIVTAPPGNAINATYELTATAGTLDCSATHSVPETTGFGFYSCVSTAGADAIWEPLC